MRLLLVFLLVHQISALFEDQIGKWDWRVEQIGCPHNSIFAQDSYGKDLLVFSTKKNVVASLNSNSGSIEWRQVNEEEFVKNPEIALYSDDLVSVLNGGEYIRVFDVNTGTLKQQTKLTTRKLNVDRVTKLGNVIIVLDNKKITAFENGDSVIWSKELTADVDWKKVLVTGKFISVIGENKNGAFERKVFLVDGQQEQVNDKVNFSLKNAIFSDNVVVAQAEKSVKALSLNEDGSISEVSSQVAGSELNVISGSFFSIRSEQQLSIFEVSPKEIKLHQKLPYTDLVTSSKSSKSPVLGAFYESTKKLKVFFEKSTIELDINSEKQAPVQNVYLLSSEDGQFIQVVLVRSDCRIDFYEGRKTSKTPNLEWSRFEALASISDVELINLPLSDSQATIEHEFDAVGASTLKSFLLRIFGQTEQLQKFVTSFTQRIVTSFQLFGKGQDSLSGAIKSIFGFELGVSKSPRAGAAASEINGEIPLERDYFNLRNIIVATTLEGSVYGIHNELGVVLWSHYLGSQFEPIKNTFGESKVPLFIQRSTAHYQYSAQAAVAFNLKASARTRIITLDPITGNVQGSHSYNTLKRIEKAPFVNEQQLHPLILLESNDAVHFLPALSKEFVPTSSVHLFFADIKNGVISGGQINSSTNSYTSLWETSLNLSPTEKIKAIQGKPPNQKVHSQGKVLGDRSVLYKYLNPNLVAIMTADNTHTTLSLYLVDAVSGQVIYTFKHDRASEPVHLLHCESWIAYTYWNEKARRTELGILELYEGLDQTNAEHFNSYTTLKHPIDIQVKSYVFPQGVSAIGATNTELGLTTRSVLIAMPFGGVMEVSRRLLDARRTVDITPEMREEMIIPYIPEIPIATEDLINYNQSVLQIKKINTAPSGLESTSLMFAHGLDLFYTRLTPSGTFDILKDDFDYILISFVMVGLVVASVVCKRLARYQSLKQAWA